MERESGHINDRYRLWETVVLEDGTEEYATCKFNSMSITNVTTSGTATESQRPGLSRTLSQTREGVAFWPTRWAWGSR